MPCMQHLGKEETVPQYLLVWSAGAIYNVVDDCPAPRGEVMEFARQLLGRTGARSAPAAAAGASEPARSGSSQPINTDAASGSV